MMLLPDENIASVYNKEVHANIKAGAALAFAHGFNALRPGRAARRHRRHHDRAEGPGHTVRNTYKQGGGVPHLVAVYQDKSGAARGVACPTPAPTAAAAPASSRPTSAKKPKPTCSANRPCCAAVPSN